VSATPRPGWFTTPDGLRLATLVWPGAGTPLYLMHATGFCAALWDPIARALGDCAAPRAMDERGHGRSDKPVADYPWSLFAEDLLAWIAAEADGPVWAVGHSCGATAVALAAAAEPQRFARVLLVDPVLLPPPPERDAEEQKGGFGLADRTRRRRGAWPSRETARAALAKRFPYSHWTAEVFALYLEHALEDTPDGGVALRCPPAIEARVYLGTAAIDPWPALPKIRARTRILLPEMSGLRPELQQRLAAAMPEAQVRRVPGTHFVAMERPDVVAEHARDLFARADR
jgi:pimeloyl-ACP methyl ester carboxylesterase